MGLSKSKGLLSFTREALAIVISIISFVVSTVNVYVTNLKSPDLSMVVAPYIKQIVDDASLNEAFFVPVTVVNRGTRPGSMLSFELNVTYLPTGDQDTFYGQYFTQENQSEVIGDFFAPVNLQGYSAISRTICFYPLGKGGGNFFAQVGTYEFTLTGIAANVKGESQKRIVQVFRVELTKEMYDQMQKEPDLEYIYPMRIEASSTSRSLIDILRSIWK